MKTRKRGGHKVKFNIKSRGYIPNRLEWRSTKKRKPNKLIEAKFEYGCSAHAFLVLGLLTEENALFLASHTQTHGLGWIQALLMLDRAFKTTHIYREVTNDADVVRYLQPGEATLGAVQPENGMGHYFVFLNHQNQIYVIDSTEQVCCDLHNYCGNCTRESDIIALVDSTTSQLTTQSITKQIITDVLSMNNSYPSLFFSIDQSAEEVLKNFKEHEDRIASNAWDD
jgi:hypothetical protein